MRLVSLLAEHLSDRRRSSFRLRSLLISIVILALGLAFTHDLRRQEIRKQLARREELIRMKIKGRSSKSEECEKRGQALLKEAEFYRSQIEQYEHPSPSRGPIIDSGLSWGSQIPRLRKELPKVLKRAEWQFSMARIARWAADHPDEPSPPEPPDPDTLLAGTTPGPMDLGGPFIKGCQFGSPYSKKPEEIGP